MAHFHVLWQNSRSIRRQLPFIVGLSLVLQITAGLGTTLAMAEADPYQMGLQRYEQGDFKGAVRFLQDAVATGKSPAEGHFYLGDAYLKLNRLTEAQTEFQRVLVAAPHSQAAKMAQAQLARLIRGETLNDSIIGWERLGSSGKRLRASDTYTGPPPQGDDYLPRVTSGGQRTRWALSTMPLRLFVEQAPAQNRNFQPVFVTQVRKAMDWWCQALGNQLSYEVVTSPDTADIRVAWVNAIDQFGGAMGDGKTAYTAGITTPQLNGLQLLNMQVKIATFDINGKPQSEQMILAVASHELGHALGLLGHSDNPQDLMFAENQQVVKPSMRDINTLRKLYSMPADVSNLPITEQTHTVERMQEILAAQDAELAAMEAEAKRNGIALGYLNLTAAYYAKAKRMGSPIEARGWYQKALEASNQAIKIEPRSAQGYQKRSLVYQELGQYDQALADIETAIRYEPTEPDYWKLQAWYAIQQNRVAVARGALDAYLRVRPQESTSEEVQKIQTAIRDSGVRR